MQKAIVILYIVLGVASIVGCRANTGVKHSLNTGNWNRSDTLTGEIQVTKDGTYTAYLEVMVDESFPYENLWTQVQYTDAQGKLSTVKLNTNISLEDGQFISNGWFVIDELGKSHAADFTTAPLGNRYIRRQFSSAQLNKMKLKSGKWRYAINQISRSADLSGLAFVSIYLHRDR
ncbi:MAG: hypothetical protein SGJ04_08700 [Bacteroidota bacterium]|nr:hypothetical protein [Bacteroidota bacterium]